jgi:hypothetical protein
MGSSLRMGFEKKNSNFFPPPDSSGEMHAEEATKHQYSSDLWPLKIKRNCIVDKSLAVRIVYLY